MVAQSSKNNSFGGDRNVMRMLITELMKVVLLFSRPNAVRFLKK